jgi:hypothetical protein
LDDIIRVTGEFNFEKEDGEFGAPYGVALLKEIYPTARRAKGMSVWMTPVGKVVVTCRAIVRI